ncbi:hypothetical protein OG625_04845 [Streptomyces sp. NBC_01351]|uniref:DUF6545 domain-containing protein n=1 Tax=Streptomyces sp. NBC_01351 TaxID=2903833 RepID=UPI002E373101|nr:DUF6545 domain-containing protein [Streptomyces sp. NBC_01351]
MWRRYHQLQPAWRELRVATRHSINLAGGISTPIEVRVTQIESDIYDGILSVHPFLNPEVRELSLAEALKTAPTDEDAAVIADAAVPAHAIVMWTRHAADQTDPPVQPAGDGPLLVSANSTPGLVRLSQALSRSGIVRAAREAAVLESSAR